MAKTSIEWTDAVWNPVTGCSKVSAGCTHCYAERMSKRLAGRCGYPKDDPFKVTLHPDRLDDPLKWKKHRRIFVNSMSDLFHEDVPFEFIDRVMNAAYKAKQHVYLVLTKRPERMKLYFESCRERGFPVVLWMQHGLNLWLGVSVENQVTADERIPLLLQTPAAVKFISAEPLLGPVDMSNLPGFDFPGCTTIDALQGRLIHHDDDCNWTKEEPLDWVIAGGESGPGARPMHPNWVRSLRDQCQGANVPFFFKQWGEWGWFQGGHPNDVKLPATFVDGEPFKAWMVRVGKKKAGRIIDGRTWDEIPGGK